MICVIQSCKADVTKIVFKILQGEDEAEAKILHSVHTEQDKRNQAGDSNKDSQCKK